MGVAGIVVCCRRSEYQNQGARLAFGSAICLQPLTEKDIDVYLVQRGENVSDLRKAIGRDERLTSLARTPLMLNIMSVAFQGNMPHNVLSDRGLNDRDYLRVIFNTYVARSIANRRSTLPTINIRTFCESLKWIATNMLRRHRSVFLIEDLQPTWLRNVKTIFAYTLLSRLLCGILLGFGLFAGLSSIVIVEELLPLRKARVADRRETSAFATSDGPAPPPSVGTLPVSPSPPLPSDAYPSDVEPPHADAALLWAEQSATMPDANYTTTGYGLRVPDNFWDTMWHHFWLLFGSGSLFGVLAGVIDCYHFRRQLRHIPTTAGNIDDAAKEFWPRDCVGCCRLKLFISLWLFWLAGIGVITVSAGAIATTFTEIVFNMGIGTLGLIWGTVFSFRAVCRDVSDDVRTIGSMRWSWRYSLIGLLIGAAIGAIIGVIASVILTLFLMFIGEAFAQSFGVTPSTLWQTVVDDAPLIAMTFAATLFAATALGCALGGLRPGILRTQESMNQGIHMTTIYSLKITFYVFCATLLLGSLSTIFLGIDGIVFFLPLSISTASVVMAWCGGFDIIQHYVLRCFLAITGVRALRITNFIVQAEVFGFIRRTGGNFIFTHRLLLEHFADENLDLLAGTKETST